MSHAVVIKNAVKKYGDFVALKGASLNIEPGQFFTLLGPSGCGKTTLLRMIAGFNTVDGGEICFDEKVINDLMAHKRDIGMVFQNYAIFPHLNVGENVAYGLKARRVSAKEIDERVDKALELVKILPLKNRKPNELSGGQQQRVALARAFVIEPSVLLMDEPLSNLDAKLRVQMRTVIKKLQRQLDITTVYVTHDQEEALAISDVIAVMKDGEIMQVGSPEAIYKQPQNKFVAGFIGISNFLPCTVEQVREGEHRIVLADGFSFTRRLRKEYAGEAILSARPEQIKFHPSEGLRGRIVFSTFLGDFVEYEVELTDGQLVQVNEYTKDSSSLISEGAEVFLNFDSSVVGIYDSQSEEALTW